ncbi:hypothetical protein ACLM5J_17345 [Nocardioides sp. Bht2]|uniref:hypothetical protein n=1 Tax=Nocardioides sp. Bht2 TaxID=3392297 RepID=UPI0039B5B69A
MLSTSKLWRKAAIIAGGTALVAGAMASPAQAATIDVVYDVNGTTHINSTNSDIAIGPATMYSFVETDGSFTGDMALPGTRTRFELMGFIPVTANVNFEPTGPTTGVVSRDPNDRTKRILNSTSNYYVRLSNIAVVGFPLFAGSNCRTSSPVSIAANTPAGENFNITVGGRLTGTYSIGNFQNCGLNTWLINSIIPGSGNTIELNLTNGRLQ